MRIKITHLSPTSPPRTKARPDPLFVLCEVKPQKCLCKCHVKHLVQPAFMISSNSHPYKCNSIKRTRSIKTLQATKCSLAHQQRYESFELSWIRFTIQFDAHTMVCMFIEMLKFPLVYSGRYFPHWRITVGYNCVTGRSVLKVEIQLTLILLSESYLLIDGYEGTHLPVLKRVKMLSLKLRLYMVFVYSVFTLAK